MEIDRLTSPAVLEMPAQLEQAIYGFATAKALHLLSKHGVIGYLSKHGECSAALIAAELKLDADTLDRVLLLLSSFGIVGVSGKSTYTIPANVAPFFDRSDSHCVESLLAHLVNGADANLAQLENYLLNGKRTASAGDGKSQFSQLYRTEKSMRAFMEAMWDLSSGSADEVAELADFGSVADLVDVGGGGGALAIAALARWPGLVATVFDLPEVENFANDKARLHGYADRIRFERGDFFADDLPKGDCIVLSSILSDWPDDVGLGLLRKAHASCDSSGRVVIIERLINDAHDGPSSAAAMNLVMHLEMNGRHRTAAEYLELLRAAGFVRCDVRRSAGALHVLIGHRT